MHGGRQADASQEHPVPMAPSVVKNGHSAAIPREMTEEEILKMIEAFTQAAVRAKKSRF